MEKRIVIVSNRLPFTIKKNNEAIEKTRSSGGLVSAIQSMQRDSKIVWIGAADFSEELWNEYKISQPDDEFEIEPLFLEKETEDRYYNGFSNAMIWPLFHYFPSIAEYNEDYYLAYREVNSQFAAAIRKKAGEGDLVWIHDYHLMLVPGMLSEGGRKASSSFFLHIPFPSYELIKLIPEDWRKDLLKSLVCCDVVGFHTRDYVNHFKNALSYFLAVECVDDCIHHEKHVTLVKDYPISIDYHKFYCAYDNEEVVGLRERAMEKFKGMKIIFSLDRLDYSKGVMNRLQAFEALLDRNTALHEKVVFIINVIPSRESISHYAERKKLIEENVSRINGLYASLQWQPIIYQYRHLSFSQLMACYSLCHVALVTPLRDGMNLVAKEFVAARKDARGCLILSEFAGAANELTEALMVNPNDILQMQGVMQKAIDMEEAEQEQRMLKMQEVVQKNDIHKWMDTFLTDALAGENRGKVKANIMSYYDRMMISESYRRAQSRLILLDYDGTLIPFYNKPEEAVPGNMIRELISKLNQDQNNHIMLISGRDADTLDNWFKDLDIGIAAEHGVMYRLPGSAHWSFPAEINLNWKEDVKSYLEKYSQSMPGSFIEEKKFSVAWHYRAVESIDEEAVRLAFSQDLMPLNIKDDFHILHGNKVIEIKSTYSNKGKFVSSYIEDAGFDFVLAIGDDVTDEDMFSILQEAHHYTIKVGHGQSAAKYNIVGVNNVLNFLAQLGSKDTYAFRYGRSAPHLQKADDRIDG